MNLNVAIDNKMDFADRAITLAYFQVVEEIKEVPYLEEVMDALPKILEQELFMDIVTKGRLETHGALDETQLAILIKSGKLDYLYPDVFEVEKGLHNFKLSYLNINHQTYNQMSIQAVW